MARNPLSWFVVAILLASTSPATADDEPALEAWADPALKVTRGLALWLDAGRINEARRALGREGMRTGGAVDSWQDASGHRRDLVQARDGAGPSYQDGALRFDGERTALELAGQDLKSRDLTVFVVAAPFANPGGFRGLLALNEEGKNDYRSGLNLDLGPSPSRRFQSLNVEGNGFGGAFNAVKDPSDFGTVRRVALTSTPGPGGVKVYLDGRPNGTRDRAETLLRMDRLTVGARRFNNEGGAPESRGFFHGDILEILVYDRVLTESERADVEKYLATRHGTGKTIAVPHRPTDGKPLVLVPDPPPVQVMVPGFAVQAFPVDLPNINNVKYRGDGKLVALAYNGDIYLLSGGNGSAPEDKVERFWENKGALTAPIGMALTPPGYRLGNGVFAACMGKVSLIVDTDGDDKADKEIVVAKGWPQSSVSVDALGVALDGDGNVYFGLGAADFANAYRIDKAGKSLYDPKSERGTILKVSPDFQKREVIATGIRFPVAMAFNRLGDLFATDQEGATWLPNGNPFDELLHVETGRHYGFPPRHPKHLPGVIDEPSVFDYGPQHQSTCGLNFNEPVNGGPTFGPPWWAGDALVTGYSRGKLYRTKLAKTSAGYIARNDTLAFLDMLAADACVTPAGDLVVAVHSGAPDWGSGPTGKGKLYKISHRDRDEPNPVLAWAAGPQEVRVAFDRPLDLSRLREIVQKSEIEYGRYVQPGDRFEALTPGYEVVARQAATPRFGLPVLSAGISGDRRTLLLGTAPHPEAASYALTFRGLGRPEKADPKGGELPQDPAIDLGYDLTGASASWTPDPGSGDAWSGWLPHLDLAAARTFTAGSAEHDRFWESATKPGLLTLRTKLDLARMLRPAVQPGSTLDATLPDEEVTLLFSGSGKIAVTSPAGSSIAGDGKEGRFRVRLDVKPKKDTLVPLEITMATGGQAALEVSFATLEDPRPRALPLRRFLLPWADTAKRSEALAEREVPELSGGDWAKGRAIFYGEQARCSGCHQVRGRGGMIGPDLSNLIHRDYASVLRDIRTPSAAINPDYVAHAVALSDGRVLQGTLRSDGDRLIVGDTSGKTTVVDREEVETTAPSSVSNMPEGLDKSLRDGNLRDLMTFLLTEPLRPAPSEAEGAPPARRRSEVEEVLKGSQPVANPRPLRILLAAGPKDHGPGEHDYPLWQKRWAPLMATADGVAVKTADGWPTPEQFAGSDLIVFYSNNPGWTGAKGEELDRYLARGGGLVYIHYAVDGHQAVDALAERIGLASRGGATKFRHGKLEVDFRGSKHPIARNFATLNLVDESYWDMIGDPGKIEVLGTGIEEGKPRPLFWTRERGKGRAFVSIPGHYTWSFDDPMFRVLLLRGMAWAAGEPVDRFNEQATLGAKLGE